MRYGVGAEISSTILRRSIHIKLCSKCNTSKDNSLFNKHKYSKDGIRGYCRECQSILKKQYRLNNYDTVTLASRLYMANNPSKKKANRLRYKHNITNATPSWADHTLMNEVYNLSKQLTKSTGIQHDVDHIVPIKGRTVCGLHCQSNLQAIPHSDNMAKLNKIWPDQW